MKLFNQFIEYRLLDHKFATENTDLIEFALKHSSSENQIGDIELRQVCAKLTVPFVERLDSTVSLLGISKRKFIEMALSEAMNRVDELAQELNVDELFEEMVEHHEQNSANGDSEK